MSPRIGVPARVRLLSVAPSGALRAARATPAGRGAFRGEPPLGHRLYRASRSVRVCHRLCLTSFSPVLPSPRPRRHHAHIVLSFSVPLLLPVPALAAKSSPLFPLPPFTCSSVFLSSLSSSFRAQRRGRRLPGAVSRLSPPRAVGRRCFFSPLCPCILPRRESAAAAAAAAASVAPLSRRIVNRDIPSNTRREKYERSAVSFFSLAVRGGSQTRMSVLNVCISSELSRREGYRRPDTISGVSE